MQHLLQHLFGKSTIREIPLEPIRQLTRLYPSFGAGHYILAKKLYELNDAAYAEQLQKTMVYFTNPLWLQYELQHSREEAVAPAASPHPPEQAEEPVSTTAAPVPALAPVTDAALPQPEAATRETLPPSGFESQYPLVVKTSLAETGTVPQAGALPEAPLPKPQQTMPSGAVPQETPVPQEAATSAVPHQEHTVQQEEPFTFQSYHTIDYFASQGIKLSQDVQPDDKLGKQLKSFTEWLKIMRKLPQPVVEEVMDTDTDEHIAQFAAHSLEEKEVVTEAMAEVLMKQGKFEKAREVYRKLSLLNPHKSAYFAAKSKF